MAPPPPYTLGGETVTRPVTPNVLARLRQDRVIQDFAQAMRDLLKGGIAFKSGIFQPGALGQSHRQSGNVWFRSTTDVDTAAHEFGHRLRDALGVRLVDLNPFVAELAAIQSRTGAAGATLREGWAEFWRLHATDPLGVAQVAPQLYRWAEAKLRKEPAVDEAWQAFRDRLTQLRAQTPSDPPETAETADPARITTFAARLKASGEGWRENMKIPIRVLGVAALLLVLLFVGPIVYRAGQRWSFYFSCPYENDGIDPDAISKNCWRMAGEAVIRGGKLP
jgi:hypothetical protein